jgi:acyl-CoA synthetase (AMP-forming)/AMP-acid ligase II
MSGSVGLFDAAAGEGAAQAHAMLPSLRRVISAGAPMPPSVLERFSRMLSPEAEIHTPYGATEALPVCSIGSHEILGETAARWASGEGTCVGRPIGGVALSIIRVTDAPIPEWSDDLRVPDGTIGEIVVKGPIVTQGYFNRPQSDALGKIRDPEDGLLMHRMGDLGWRDEQGRIWFCGRKAHRVETAEGPLFTIPCEAIFNQHPAVNRTALVGVGPQGRQKPVICVELDATLRLHGGPAAVLRDLQAYGRRFAHTRGIETFLVHPGAFPVDIRHNAKIFREKLAVWASEQLK